MTSQIIALPKEVVSKIAAGEVVERPSSVVKELLENSIDAGATRIECELGFGGRELIRVADNGWGMSEGDALLSVERYTTSKIRSVDDLEQISTFGFRGEALPSIAQVSKLEILTRRAEDQIGTFVLVEGGEVKEHREAPRQVGTTVSVHSLFYNLPVRRKFLKSEATELRRILDELKAQGLAHPQISFTVSHSGESLITLPGVETHEERLYSLFGGEVLNSMVSLRGDGPGAELHGYFLLPQLSGPKRSFQFIFLNSRLIRDRIVSHAVYQGYGGSPGGLRPAFILFLKVDPKEVDINVHPTKREVRFRNDRAIHDLISGSVRRSLRRAVSGDRPHKTYPLPGGRLTEEAVRETQEEYRGEELELGLEGRVIPHLKPSVGLFWQLHNTYILAQTRGGVLIVDQHAAHERIIFDQVVKRRGVLPQQLLFPVTFNLSPNEELILDEWLPSLLELGFRLKRFSGRTLVVEAVPSCLESVDEEQIRSLLEELASLGKGGEEFEEVCKAFACKTAVKAGQPLRPEEMNSLIDKLFATDLPYLCPHGRPTMIKLPLDELEKRLGRT